MFLIFRHGLASQRIQQSGKILCFIAVRIGKTVYQLGFHGIVQLPVGRGDGSAVGLRNIEQIRYLYFGVFVDADGDALGATVDIPPDIIPLLGRGKHRHVGSLPVNHKGVVKAVLVESRPKGEVVPPVVFTSDDLRRQHLVDGFQPFFCPHLYQTSFLT